MQHVTSHGAPKITMDSRDRDYESSRRQAEAQGDGNPHVMGVQEPQRQSSTTNNTPITDPRDLSGDVDLGTSMTENATSNPDQFQTEELDRRLQMYSKAASNAGYSLNDRANTGSIGNE
jgi:hypothetical protein